MFIILAILFAVILLVVYCNKKSKEDAQYWEMVRRKKEQEQEYQANYQKYEEYKTKAQVRAAQERLDRSYYADLDKARQKLDSAVSSSIKASILKKRIEEMEEQIASFTRLHPDKYVGPEYSRSLDRARKKYQKMSEWEQKLSKAPNGPEPKKAAPRPRNEERSKLTKSLRYDILQRDNFRCCICGRTAQDGVVLHVDHIVPIAKGGKTVPENLRTLCADCNLGKSDKYDGKKDSPAEGQRPEKAGGAASAPCSAEVSKLKKRLEEAGKLYVDKTPFGGCLWVAADQETDAMMKDLTINGNRPRYVQSAKTFGGDPGWYIMP